MKKNQLATLAIGLTLLGSALAVVGWPETRPEEPAGRSRHVARVDEVKLSTSGRTIRLAGVTESSTRATLAFTVPARVIARTVDVGDEVRDGQALARIDDREYRLAEQTASALLSEIDVRLSQAGRDLERVERLAAARAATDEELEQTRAAAHALEAARLSAASRLAETRRLLRETTLVAPFAGSIAAVFLESGEWAAPGAPVMALAGAGSLEVRVEIPEALLSLIEQGDPATVELPFVGRTVTGRIATVADAARGPGALFPVEVVIDDGAGLVPGMAAEVVLAASAAEELTVPLAAVISPGSSRPVVFRVKDGRAERVEVTLGAIVGDRVAVAGRLDAGDRVAVSGHTTLIDGDLVEVL